MRGCIAFSLFLRKTGRFYLSRFGLRPSNSLTTKEAVLADQFTVEKQRSTPHSLFLTQHEIPVDRGLIAVAGFFVAGAGSEVDGAGDFFVEENVLHRLGAERVEADGEFTDIACAGISVEDFVEFFGGAACCLDDFAVFEGKADIGVGDAAVEGGDVVVDDAVDAVAHRGGIHFAVRDVAMAVAQEGGDALDGEV